MGKFYLNLRAWLLRLRYPSSTLDEVTEALGIDVPSSFSFIRFLNRVSSAAPRSHKLKRYMPRHKAEAVFTKAIAKDSYRNDTYFSYGFSAGCLEVHLSYDCQSRLRRAYMLHRLWKEPKEIYLSRA